MTIVKNKTLFFINNKVRAINVKPFQNNIAPPLIREEDYIVKNVVLDRKGNQHLDVGLISEYNYISSKETGEELPSGDKIHWCHPSRFIKLT